MHGTHAHRHSQIQSDKDGEWQWDWKSEKDACTQTHTYTDTFIRSNTNTCMQARQRPYISDSIAYERNMRMFVVWIAHTRSARFCAVLCLCRVLYCIHMHTDQRVRLQTQTHIHVGVRAVPSRWPPNTERDTTHTCVLHRINGIHIHMYTRRSSDFGDVATMETRCLYSQMWKRHG